VGPQLTDIATERSNGEARSQDAFKMRKPSISLTIGKCFHRSAVVKDDEPIQIASDFLVDPVHGLQLFQMLPDAVAERHVDAVVLVAAQVALGVNAVARNDTFALRRSPMITNCWPSVWPSPSRTWNARATDCRRRRPPGSGDASTKASKARRRSVGIDDVGGEEAELRGSAYGLGPAEDFPFLDIAGGLS